MYELKKLSPRIVDAAISMIETGAVRYTCTALSKAASAIHKKGSAVSLQYRTLHRSVNSGAWNRYLRGQSSWWNSGLPCKASRIKALEATKEHIIKENSK